jgi:hypothetical protein
MKLRSDCQESQCGFTRLDLVVLLAAAVLLGAVIRPVWGVGGPSKSLVCMENLRRLSTAWLMFADDNGGKFVGNYHGGFLPTPSATEHPWAAGWLDWTTSSDNTNSAYLLNPRYAALAPYLARGASVFRCPADDFLSRAQVARGWIARVRSYSLSAAFGEGNASTGPINPALLQVTRNSGFGKLPPQQAFVFLEEHPDSINDPLFFSPQSVQRLVDFPSSLHDGAAWFTFADGHLELHRWQSPQIPVPVKYAFPTVTLFPGNNPDLKWLLDHTPQK